MACIAMSAMRARTVVGRFVGVVMFTCGSLRGVACVNRRARRYPCGFYREGPRPKRKEAVVGPLMMGYDANRTVFGRTASVLSNRKCSERERHSSRMDPVVDHPPRLSRRERRRLNTRAEILEAARELLLEVGPEELSLRQVARRADFSPAALYTYFASRDELIASLFAECFDRLDAYVRRVPTDLPPDKRVIELGVAYMDFAVHNPMDLRCMLLSTSLDLPPSSGLTVGQSLAQLIGETFRQGVEQGVFRPKTPLSTQEMAYGVWALVHGMASVAGLDLSEVADDISADPRRVLEAFVALLTAPADH